MDKVSRLLGFIFFCYVIYKAIILGGSIGLFINIPSQLICVLIPLALSLFIYGLDPILHALASLISSFPFVPHISSSTLLDAQIIRQNIMHVYAAGILGTLIGLVQMLSGLDDFSAIHIGFSVLLLCPLYSVLIAEGLLRPMAVHIELKLEGLRSL